MNAFHRILFVLICVPPILQAAGVVTAAVPANTLAAPFTFLPMTPVMEPDSPGRETGEPTPGRWRPEAAALTADGNLWLADPEARRVVMLDSAGRMVRRIGPGEVGRGAMTAPWDAPTAVATSPDGGLFVAEAGAGRIWWVPPAGGAIELASSLGEPSGLAWDAARRVLYVADARRHAVEQVDLGGNIARVAGTGRAGFRDGDAYEARLDSPHHLALDAEANLFIADTGNGAVRRLSPDGRVTTIARGLPGPVGIAVDSAGTLAVSCSKAHALLLISSEGAVTPLGGMTGFAGCAAGEGMAARFHAPGGLAWDAAAGALYVADAGNGTVMVGKRSLADAAVVDEARGATGQIRRLDTVPRTAGAWSWSVGEAPPGSRAAISSPLVPDPEFTPDLEGRYRIELIARTPTAHSISTVLLFADCPTVVTSPSDRAACAGTSTTFQVLLSQYLSPAYQWKKDGAVIPGATGDSHTIDPVAVGDAGSFVCDITDTCGPVSSTPAELVVGTFTPAPVEDTLTVVKGAPGLQLRWTDIGNATQYPVYEDTAASGAFATVTGTAPDGITGLGIPIPGTNRYYKVAASNDCGTGSKDPCGTITVNPSSLPGGTAGSAYNQTITQTGAGSGVGFSVSSGGLPAGLNLAGGTGVLSGTLSPSGTYEFTVSATDAAGCSGYRAYAITVTCNAITVSPSSLSNGVYSVAYTPVQFTQTGGTAPIAWSSTGTLPTGMTFSSGGSLSGTPTSTGSYTVTFIATDTNGCTGSRQITFAVRPKATNDTYNGGVGHTQYAVNTSAPSTPAVFVNSSTGVLGNDAGTGSLSAALLTGPANGAVALNANGTFTYTPNVNFTGPSDSFTYTLTDGSGQTNTATVTINLSQKVWYVDNTYGGGSGASDGRSHRPFTTLTAAGGATGNANGDYIFVHQGSGTTTGGITLKPSQTLWGQGTAFTLNNLTIAATAKPTVNGTVNLANSVTVSSLNISTGTSTGITNPAAVTGVTITNAVAVTTTTGTAVLLNNAGGAFSFLSVSANGGANGISLTSQTGSFAVTGSGTASSGGSIVNMVGADGATAGIGIYMNGAQSVSIAWMALSGHQNFAVRGTTVSGFTMNNTVVSGTNGTSDIADEACVSFANLTGTAAFTSCNISGGVEDNVRIVNTGGTLNRVTFSATTLGANSTTLGDNSLYIEGSNAAVINITIQNSFLTAARGDLFHLNLLNTAACDLIFTGNACSNNHPAIAAGGGIWLTGGGTGSNPTLTFNIANSTFRGAMGSALNITKGEGTGFYSGTISGNTMGVQAVANSGSTAGSDIWFGVFGGGTVTASILNNYLYQYNGYGIYMQSGDGSLGGNGTLNATIQGNTISNPGTGGALMNGIHLNCGTTTGDVRQCCANIGGAGGAANTIGGSGAGSQDARLRQRMLTTVRLPGYAGANNDNAAVVLFIQNRNNGAETVSAINSVSTGGGGFIGTGSSCP